MNATPATCTRIDPAKPPHSRVLDVLRRHKDAYVERYGADPQRLHVLRQLLACRTAASGLHLKQCLACGWRGLAYNACRNRHCPQCQARDAAAWADATTQRMLPTPHFQVVFTLPEQLRNLAFVNQKLLYNLIFQAAASVLHTLARQRLKGTLGFTAVLHTWTSDLRYHPHLHCIVSAGALRSDDTEWVPSHKRYLFPRKVLADMFRGAFLAPLLTALERGKLQLPHDLDLHQVRAHLRQVATRKQRWIVHVEPPKGRPTAHIARYLARYVKRVAITDARIHRVTDTHVTLRTRTGLLELTGVEFVRRFLLHFLPKRLRKVRHYGLYAPANIRRRLPLARRLLAPDAEAEAEAETPQATEQTDESERCPACDQPHVHRILDRRRILQALRELELPPRRPP